MAKNSLSLSRRIWRILIEILVGLSLLFMVAFSLIHLLYQAKVLNSLGVMDDISIEQIQHMDSISELEHYLSSYHIDYVIFNEKGQIESSLFEKSQEALAKQAFMDNMVVETASESYRPYPSGNRRTIVVRFPLIPEFSNRELRRKYDFNQISSTIMIGLVFLVTIFPFIRFVYQAKKEFQILEETPRKIVKLSDKSEIDKVRIKEIRQSISSIKDMKERLEKLIEYEQQEKKDLIFQVSALSHDIKTPLTIIKGNVGLLEDCDSQEEVAECLTYINDGIYQIESYLDLMVNYSKWIYQPDAKHKTNISSLITSISSQIQGYFKRGIHFEIKNESERDSLYCSSSNIQRAIINILTNAFDFAESQVSLTISDNSNYLIFQIYNDGLPIDKKGLENIGKLFYTQNIGRNAPDKHYGLGLYFARLTAYLHNGYLECHNLDKGVVFNFAIEP